MGYAEKAREIFMTGFNCSQAVFAAFSDVVEMDETMAKKISIGLGGGVGRLREVCGAVSGAAMVLGALSGGEEGENKAAAYAEVQKMAEDFKKENGSIICREILGIDKAKKEGTTPEERTQQYYKSRPCADKVYSAAKIVEEYLKGKST
ncbi:MAG: C_GCAxxG_C_C family protein [Clostridia bacterium]|nr:C_GCAxxG_C_C family protein [Clostridia bacterium]